MNESLQEIVNENSYEIRLNRLEDQEQMAKIKVNSWQKTYKNIIDEQYLNSLNIEEQTTKYIASFDDYKNCVLVAINKENNQVIGYSCFDSNEKEEYNADCEIVSLYIDPNFTNKGIGTSLFRETIKYLKGYNKRNMLIWCLKENKNALEFYKKLGGIKTLEKLAKIGNKVYPEYGIIFDINKFNQ